MRQRRYVAYLLRLWLSDHAGQSVWRGSLEDPHSGSRIGFGDGQSLLAYLLTYTPDAPGACPQRLFFKQNPNAAEARFYPCLQRDDRRCAGQLA